MPGTRFRAARDLFERVLGMSTIHRAEVLAEVDSASLRDEVERLIRADAESLDLDGVVRVAPAPPDQIGPYRVTGELGRGAMGVVYGAEELAPRRRVALKVLHPWLRSPGCKALARHEAQALADVAHPGIPVIYALIEVDDAPVVVMERVEGLRLTACAATLDARARLALLARICDAVASAHSRGIVHRDLKPANILVTAACQPKILDFGIALQADSAPPPGSGTPAYMPPEQRRRERATPASDVYALGVVCCEVLAGGLPAGATAEHATDAQRRAALLRSVAGLREDLRAVLARALASEPEDRYPDARALAHALRRCERRRWSPWRVGALILAGAVGVALLAQGLSVGSRLHGIRAARTLDELRSDPAGEARLGALAGAWVFASPQETAATDALVQALLDAGDGRTASLVGAPTAGSARAALALSQWDLSSLDPAQRAGRWARALAMATPTGADVGSGALLGALGRLSTRGMELCWEPASGPSRSWPLPGPGTGAGASFTVDGQRFAVQADRWIATGRLDAAGITRIDLPGQGSQVLFDDRGSDSGSDSGPDSGEGTPDLLVAMAQFSNGAWRVGADGLRALHAGTNAQALPVRALVQADLDGDGQTELVLGATGWRGHELRVLGRKDGAWEVRDRLRMGVVAMASRPGPRGAVLYAVGGPAPAEAAPSASRTALVAVSWADGHLVAGAARALPQDVLAVFVADVDGDGASELVLRGVDGVGILDPDGTDALWIPGLTLLDAGQADADAAAELWVNAGEESYILGLGAVPLPTRRFEQPGLASPPPSLPRPLQVAWSRAETLRAVGREALAMDPLYDLCLATGFRPEIVSAALASAARSSGSAGREVGQLASRLLRTGKLDATATALATDLLRRAHAVDDPAFPPLTERTLSFDQPLPAVAVVGDFGVARRDALAGTLELDLRGDSGVVFGLPLLWDGVAACVDLDLDLVEVDWSAGLVLGFQQGARRTLATLWRVGGGPREGHHLSLSAENDGGAQADFRLGPHTASVCLSADPAEISVQLDALPRRVAPSAAALQPGEIWLSVSPSGRADEAIDRRARIDVRQIRLRGAQLAAGPLGPALYRAAADGETEAIAEVFARGTPYAQAVAAVALGRVAQAPLRSLSRRDLRALLRGDPALWGGRIRALVGADFPALWAEAWEVPLYYEDPWVLSALLDPSLEGLPLRTRAGEQVSLARAAALLQAGQLVPAEALLATLHTPDAELLRARLDARMNRPEQARAALRAWLAEAPSPEDARDQIAANPELAALMPDLPVVQEAGATPAPSPPLSSSPCP